MHVLFTAKYQGIFGSDQRGAVASTCPAPGTTAAPGLSNRDWSHHLWSLRCPCDCHDCRMLVPKQQGMASPTSHYPGGRSHYHQFQDGFQEGQPSFMRPQPPPAKSPKGSTSRSRSYSRGHNSWCCRQRQRRRNQVEARKAFISAFIDEDNAAASDAVMNMYLIIEFSSLLKITYIVSHLTP